MLPFFIHLISSKLFLFCQQWPELLTFYIFWFSTSWLVLLFIILMEGMLQIITIGNTFVRTSEHISDINGIAELLDLPRG